MNSRKFGLLFTILWAWNALALETAYVSFDHPEGWRCELSQGVWICQNTQEPDRRESVVLSIATMATEWDTLDNYLKYLSEPRTLKEESGKTIRSKVTYARKRNINGVQWVDSLQHNSELPGFWSRYVATVQNKLAILITYIVSDEHYSKMAPQFERMVSSLKPRSDFDLNVASKQGDGPIPGSTKLGPLTKSILADRLNTQRKTAEQAEELPEEQGSLALALGVLLMGAGAVFWVLHRRKKHNAALRENRNRNRKAS
jgi:hypothetical protein